MIAYIGRAITGAIFCVGCFVVGCWHIAARALERDDWRRKCGLLALNGSTGNAGGWRGE